MLRRPVESGQFTSAAFTGLLLDQGIRISMDGRGCWRDNIFVERLWRTLKYGEVYLHASDSVSAATAGIGRYFTLYDTRRPHSSLDDRTPDEAYFFPRPLAAAAQPARRSTQLTPTLYRKRSHFCLPNSPVQKTGATSFETRYPLSFWCVATSNASDPARG